MINSNGLFVSENIFPTTSGNTIYSYGVLELFTDLIGVDILTKSSSDGSTLSNFLELTEFEILFLKKNTHVNKLIILIRLISGKSFLSKKTRKLLDLFFDNKHYDVIIFDHLITYKYYQILRAYFINSKFIYISHNFELFNFKENESYVNIKRMALSIGSFLSVCHLYLKERLMLKKTNFIIFISNYDKNLIEKFYRINLHTKSITIMPTLEFKSNANFVDNKSIVFLGTMSWYPNIEAIKFFIKNYFNSLIKIDNEWKLYIVGRDPSNDIIGLSSKNIMVTGEVINVDDYVLKSKISIVPNMIGSGLKIKFHESVMRGITTFATQNIIDSYEINFFPNEMVLGDFDTFYSTLNSISLRQDFEEFRKNYIDYIKLNKIKYRNALKDFIELNVS